MRIPEPIVMMSAGGVSSVAALFFEQAIEVMLPWLMTTAAVVIADLAAGVRKSHLLGIHVNPSTAFRETLGKLVVYFSAVAASAMISIAARGDEKIAKWCCLLIMVIEGCSVVSNWLTPHGIRLSPKAVLKFFLKRSPLGVSDEDAEAFFENVRKENAKWNQRKYSGDKGIEDRPVNRVLDDSGKIYYKNNFDK